MRRRVSARSAAFAHVDIVDETRAGENKIDNTRMIDVDGCFFRGLE